MIQINKVPLQLNCAHCQWRSAPQAFQTENSTITESSACPVCENHSLYHSTLHMLDMLFVQASQNGVLETLNQTHIDCQYSFSSAHLNA